MALRFDSLAISVYNRIVFPPTKLHYAKRCFVAFKLLLESLSLLIRVLGNLYNARKLDETMKFQVRVQKVGKVVKIIVQKPHGNKWVTKHVHSYIPADNAPMLGDFDTNIAKALIDAKVEGIDVTLYGVVN